MGRTLHPNPDRTIDTLLTACPKCQAAFPEASQTPQQVYERIELSPFARMRPRYVCLAAAAPVAALAKVVLTSPVVCSDETSVRVKGKNWWEWVFVTTLAVLHVIQPSRGKAVVTALFGAIRPEVCCIIRTS